MALYFVLLNFISSLFFWHSGPSLISSFYYCRKYSSVLMMTPKISMSVNFINISLTSSLLWELMKSLNTTDNSFSLNIFPVYCDLNIYLSFYCSSLSSLTSFSFQHHVKYFPEIPMY